MEVDYLAGASRLVVADLVLEVLLENVSDGPLLPLSIDVGQRISDAHDRFALLFNLHSEIHSADVT